MHHPFLPLPKTTCAGTNVAPLVPALEKIWADSMGQSLADFNFRWVPPRPLPCLLSCPLPCYVYCCCHCFGPVVALLRGLLRVL